jgi:hypothetical protein
MVALGMSRVPRSEQRHQLGGLTASELAGRLARDAGPAPDLGDSASVCWAAAETGAAAADQAIARLRAALEPERDVPTVHLAWALTALVAARDLHILDDLIDRTAKRLLSARRPGRALFAHQTGAGRFVSCFADQVYPIQALARYAAAYSDRDALAVANACAGRICELQGPAGQWWWHYDSRTDEVVEGYPVYSVHQHGMAPMALNELRWAGGDDFRLPVARGMAWLSSHPENAAELIDEEHAVVWRKVARREFPNKSIRAAQAALAQVSPRLRLGGTDVVAPPVRVDRECRPYELAWLLYAWQPAGGDLDGDHAY